MEKYKKDMIEHHGILGQKWGKKNGPPYPLERTGKWSAKEKLKNASKKFKDFRDYVPEDEQNVEKKSLFSGPPYPEKSRKEIKEEAKKLRDEYWNDFVAATDRVSLNPDEGTSGYIKTKTSSGQDVEIRVTSAIMEDAYYNSKKLVKNKSKQLDPKEHTNLVKKIPTNFQKVDDELRKRIADKGKKIRFDSAKRPEVWIDYDGTGELTYYTGLAATQSIPVDWKNGKILD